MANITDETRDSGLKDKAGSMVEQTGEKAQETVGQLREQGRTRMREQLDQRTTQAGGQVRSFSEALRTSGQQLREQGKSGPAGFAEQAAQRLEGLGGYLEQTDGERMLNDVEDFARRRPWMIAGIGAAVGFAASRFLKASSEGRYQASGRSTMYSGSGQGYGYGSSTRAESAAYGAGRGLDVEADRPLSRETVDPAR